MQPILILQCNVKNFSLFMPQLENELSPDIGNRKLRNQMAKRPDSVSRHQLSGGGQPMQIGFVRRNGSAGSTDLLFDLAIRRKFEKRKSNVSSQSHQSECNNLVTMVTIE